MKYREEYEKNKGRSQMEFGDTQTYKVSKEAQKMQSEVRSHTLSHPHTLTHPHTLIHPHTHTLIHTKVHIHTQTVFLMPLILRGSTGRTMRSR